MATYPNALRATEHPHDRSSWPVEPSRHDPRDPSVGEHHELAGPARDGATGAPDAAGARTAPGKPRGNKHEMPLHLPRATFDRLVAHASRAQVSRGVAVMRALRSSYADLVARVEAARGPASPFPAERRSRRRRHPDGAVRTSIIVWPEEAVAVSEVAEQLDMSCSELVTLALDFQLDR